MIHMPVRFVGLLSHPSEHMPFLARVYCHAVAGIVRHRVVVAARLLIFEGPFYTCSILPIAYLPMIVLLIDQSELQRRFIVTNVLRGILYQFLPFQCIVQLVRKVCMCMPPA